MPLSRKEGDKERTAKSQEQELKRARGAISCAECRRLKLKCDKTVPCSSCKRRGCASICPNGSLTTGQGTRFILADTDRLHRKIAEMSDRIRQLEDGLAILQSSVARDPHPLLAVDLLKIKSGLELHSAAEGASNEALGESYPEDEEEPAYVDAFGTLAVRDDGAATFYGRSAGSEDEKPSLAISTLSHSSSGQSNLPEEIQRLASSFPHGPPEVPIFDPQDIIQGYLPPWPRARQLRDLYLEQAPWFFGAVTQRQLYDEVFPLFYEEAAEEARARRTGGFVGSAEGFNLPIPSVTHASSHELALMLVVFCFGALTDATLPPAPHNLEAEKYYQLTKAALSLEPVMDRAPSIATVQVLSLMAIYQGMVADERSIESTWALMGLASKLAQSLTTPLDRDSSRFKLSAAETQKRRALFWELFITDCWQALATGRLPTFELPFVDSELPADPDETLADDGTPQPSFPAWKARWGKECVSPVVMGTLTAQPPKYSHILELDRRIRDMPLPKYAHGPPPQNAGLAQTMSHYMPINYLHLTLLYVHRVFFARALHDYPTDPMRSPYAPSFLAGYRSASALLSTVREQFALFPTQIARFWVLWTHAFSACVMMGSVVTRGGTTKTAQAALSELRLACEVFEHAATQGGRAAKFVPILRKLLDKAHAAHFQGLQPLRRDIFTPRTAEPEHDELSIFIATKSNRPQRTSPSVNSSASPGSQNGSDQDARNSQSPGSEVFPGLDSSYRTAVHPNLVAELRSFEGQLDAQINQSSAFPSYADGSQQNEFANAGSQQQAYGAPQGAYVDQHQSGHIQQDPQASWYQAEHSYIPPVVPGPPQQQQQQPPQSHQQQQYPSQFVHSQQNVPSHASESQSQSHGQSYYPHAAASQTSNPTPIASHPHDIPVYGAAFSKAPSTSSSHYENHPYAHVAANASSQSLHDYSGYTAHSVPDQRSELWTVNVPPNEAHYDMHARIPVQTDEQYAHHTGQYQHNMGVAQPQPLQPQHTGHAQYAEGQPLQSQHVDHGHPSYAPPPPLQPQHTGQSQRGLYPQHTGNGHMPQHQEQALHPQYAYEHVHQQQQQEQQHHHMMPPPPPPPQQPINIMQNGYSLQETWTTFFQHELPMPPGGR
ncbi:hypothetical protein C8Q74DRAFT_1318239 [Fomes fomentarius]|nr:hypothetical protein C8Q74DRAFT_1318239 [Fomes fomentarius]